MCLFLFSIFVFFFYFSLDYLLRPRERLRNIVTSKICLSVSLSARVSPEPHARSLPNFVHVAHVRDSVFFRHVDDRPHRLSTGRGDGSAQRGQSVIYDCLVCSYFVCFCCVRFNFFRTKPRDWLGKNVSEMTCFVSIGTYKTLTQSSSQPWRSATSGALWGHGPFDPLAWQQLCRMPI